MIENMLRALFGHELTAAFRTRGSDHRHAGGPTELHPGNTHPTTGPMYKKRFARCGMTTVKKRLISGGIGHKHRSSLGE